MKKERIRAVFFVCAFLLFLALMDYPYLSRLYNDHISGRVIASFSGSEADADCRKRLRWAQAYNRYLAGLGSCPGKLSDDAGEPRKAVRAGGGLVPARATDDLKAKTGAETGAEKEWMEAARVLCLEENGPAGWIRVPRLDLTLPLYPGTEENVLGKGAGILEHRSLPVGGDSTHTCISAHRGLPDRTLFTNLDLLEQGDLIEIHTLGRTICYQVFGNETVLPSDTEALRILPGRDLLTLITCTPYGINSHRLFVHARRYEEKTGLKEGDPEEDRFSIFQRLADPVFWKLWWWAFATPALLLLLFLLVARFFR